ncbi:hypothetical protein NQ314_017784 [Rhamnusium bicolor]|uniref:Laminin G domain-containing protein n=1 Tax=Rhamnusium bicolor TaxID=1586634 RepID=A0AAV8WTP0_9CUCU|nr:hypothetical protein NQ314_017784 [Rhamnusium bicolor]
MLDNCAYISLFLENGYLKFNVNHSNGVNSMLTLDSKYNNGRKYQAEITMEYDTKTGLQHYILFAKNDTSQDRKQSSNTLNKKSVFKIKQATHYIGGVPPTFNNTCIPLKITSFLGFLSLTSQLTNESISYGVLMTNKEVRYSTSFFKINYSQRSGTAYLNPFRFQATRIFL